MLSPVAGALAQFLDFLLLSRKHIENCAQGGYERVVTAKPMLYPQDDIDGILSFREFCLSHWPGPPLSCSSPANVAPRVASRSQRPRSAFMVEVPMSDATLRAEIAALNAAFRALLHVVAQQRGAPGQRACALTSGAPAAPMRHAAAVRSRPAPDRWP